MAAEACSDDRIECPYLPGSPAAAAWKVEHDRYLAQRSGMPTPWAWRAWSSHD